VSPLSERTVWIPGQQKVRPSRIDLVPLFPSLVGDQGEPSAQVERSVDNFHPVT
jgi:hypothetical protein